MDSPMANLVYIAYACAAALFGVGLLYRLVIMPAGEKRIGKLTAKVMSLLAADAKASGEEESPEQDLEHAEAAEIEAYVAKMMEEHAQRFEKLSDDPKPDDSVALKKARTVFEKVAEHSMAYGKAKINFYVCVVFGLMVVGLGVYMQSTF